MNTKQIVFTVMACQGAFLILFLIGAARWQARKRRQGGADRRRPSAEEEADAREW